MPGAELNETVGEDAWRATMHVKLGPIALQFRADVRRQEVDEAARRVVVSANAREVKGRGGARAKIESTLYEAGGGTRVAIVTDLSLQGPVAQYGRGVVVEVATQLTKQFADCVARKLAESEEPEPAGGTPPAAIPVGGVRLALAGLWHVLERMLRRA
jgi:carbon monoxide dehydrogenase subunit G